MLVDNILHFIEVTALEMAQIYRNQQLMVLNIVIIVQFVKKIP